MSRDSHAATVKHLAPHSPQQHEALARLQLLTKLLSPTHPLSEDDREELALWFGELLHELSNG